MELKFRKFQQGGAVPTEEAPVNEAAPVTEQAPQEAQDPVMQLAQMAMQALQSGDCNTAMQVCQGFVQLIQSAQQGGGAPAPEQSEPVYRKGGVLVKRIKK